MKSLSLRRCCKMIVLTKILLLFIGVLFVAFMIPMVVIGLDELIMELRDFIAECQADIIAEERRIEIEKRRSIR